MSNTSDPNKTLLWQAVAMPIPLLGFSALTCACPAHHGQPILMLSDMMDLESVPVDLNVLPALVAALVHTFGWEACEPLFAEAYIHSQKNVHGMPASLLAVPMEMEPPPTDYPKPKDSMWN
jgi:hypothetical protein